MNKLSSHSLFGIMLALTGSLCAQSGANSTPARKDVQVQLLDSVKAKKVKVGDTVTAITVAAVTLPNGTAVPARTNVIGHIRQVEADSGDAHASLLAISFDEVQIKKSQNVPLHCFIRAALLPKLKGTYGKDNTSGTSLPPVSASGPLRDGMSSTAVNPGNYSNANGALNQGSLKIEPGNSDSVGVHSGQVVGLEGVELLVNEADRLSTFKSAHKNLELDEGMQLMLTVVE